MVDEGFERVPDDFRGERLGRVVRARGRAGRRLDHEHAAGTMTVGRLRRSRRMIPMNGRSRSRSSGSVGATARRARSASSTWALSPICFGERGLGGRHGRWLVVLDPGEDRARQGVVRPP